MRHDRPNPEPRLTGTFARVLGPVGPEVTCERCFELLDEYVDLEVAGADPNAALPGMRAHLDGCPACHEDHDSLRELVGGTTAKPAATENLLTSLPVLEEFCTALARARPASDVRRRPRCDRARVTSEDALYRP